MIVTNPEEDGGAGAESAAGEETGPPGESSEVAVTGLLASGFEDGEFSLLLGPLKPETSPIHL